MKDNKSESNQPAPNRKIRARQFSDVFPSLFPSPTAKLKKAFRAFHEWNKAQISGCGPRIVFFSSDHICDSSSFVLPFLIASAGVTVPTVLMSPQHFWNQLSLLTGMNLTLSPSEFSHLLDSGQTAICHPAADLENCRERKSKTTTEFIHSYLQTVFLVLCQSPPDYTVFDIKIGREKCLQSMEQGFELADNLQKLCAHLHIKSTSVFSDYFQPTGQSLGEFLNLREGLILLSASGPSDLLKLILELGTAGLKMIFPQTHQTELKMFLKNLLISGKAKEKARGTIVRQGGTSELFDALHSEPDHLSPFAVASPKAGYVQNISWTKALSLQRKLERQHPDCGIVFLKKTGDPVAKGEYLGQIYLPGDKESDYPDRDFLGLFSISAKPAAFRPLILGRL